MKGFLSVFEENWASRVTFCSQEEVPLSVRHKDWKCRGTPSENLRFVKGWTVSSRCA